MVISRCPVPACSEPASRYSIPGVRVKDSKILFCFLLNIKLAVPDAMAGGRLTRVQDRTSAAMFGPGQRIDAAGTQGELRVTRMKDFTNFDLHLCVGPFVMSGQHAGLDNCINHTCGDRKLKSVSCPQVSLKLR